MLNLLLAILTSALISILMRVSENYISNNISMLAINYVVCSILAALYAGPARLLPLSQEGFPFALILGCVGGVLFLSSFILLQWNISTNGVVLSSTFMKLGVLVPTALSVLLFHEIPTLVQVVGFVGALAAILLIHFEGGGGKAASHLGLILLLVLGGSTDFLSKIFEVFGLPALKNQFLFYIFFVALLLCIGLCVKKQQRLGKMELLFGALIGIPNYLTSRFLLLSLDTVPAVVAYPTYSVSVIVLTSCAGVLFFKEKLSRRRAIALGIILVALVLLNL